MNDDAGEGVVYGRPQAAACSLLDARPRRKGEDVSKSESTAAVAVAAFM
jgi:hypothetical protein